MRFLTTNKIIFLLLALSSPLLSQSNPVVSLVGGLATSINSSLNTGRLASKALYADYKLYGAYKAQYNASPETLPYEHFAHLKRHDLDRSRTLSLVFLSFTCSQYLPYFVMYNPTLLPSTFQARYHSPSSDKMTTPHPSMSAQLATTKRRQAASLSNAALSLAASAHKPGFIEGLNPLGKTAAKRRMESTGDWCSQLERAFRTSDTATLQANLVDSCYFNTTSAKSAFHVLPPVFTATSHAVLTGEAFYTPLIPQFILRMTLQSHLKTLMETDAFLSKHSNPDIVNTMSCDEVSEYAVGRCIAVGGLPRMRTLIGDYLAVIQSHGNMPTRDGFTFDESACRAGIIGINAIQNVAKEGGGGLVGALHNNVL